MACLPRVPGFQTTILMVSLTQGHPLMEYHEALKPQISSGIPPFQLIISAVCFIITFSGKYFLKSLLPPSKQSPRSGRLSCTLHFSLAQMMIIIHHLCNFFLLIDPFCWTLSCNRTGQCLLYWCGSSNEHIGAQDMLVTWINNGWICKLQCLLYHFINETIIYGHTKALLLLRKTHFASLILNYSVSQSRGSWVCCLLE